ncbi:MAG: DUF1614 domain-containing protein [Gammaproteobacteria bacterium]|nr:DUF1614 domain-containing protein [Gammaproteobacteria bacterium]
MRFAFDPLRLIFFVALLAGLVLVLQFELARVAFERLGLAPGAAYLLLAASLAGSLFNLPLFTVANDVDWLDNAPEHASLLRIGHLYSGDRTLVCLNVGGGLVPILFSIYLLGRGQIDVVTALAGISLVAMVAYVLSRPIRGLGIAMPLLVAPIVAALVGVGFGAEHRAALAYVAGTCGVLVGADLLRLPDVRRLGVPFAAIGGAGTFDGIFITGIIAVLLA